MESNMKDKKQQAVPQSEAESFGIKIGIRRKEMQSST